MRRPEGGTHMVLRLSTAIVVIATAAIGVNHAQQSANSETEFFSAALNRNLVVLPGVFGPVEAEKQVLPYMSQHRDLFAGKTVLDIGTGSGIIAIHAARLGAKRVVATDISAAAVECARLNADRFGVGAIVETRLVTPGDRSAFAVVAPDEAFDTIVSNPPYTLDLDARDDSTMIDRGDLGFSIVRGLQSHLKPDGTAMLLYATYFYHEVIARYARSLGHDVRSFAPDYSTPWEQDVLFNAYAKRIAARERIEPSALRFDWTKDDRRAVGNQFRLYKDVRIPVSNGIPSGLIVINKGVRRPAPTPQQTPLYGAQRTLQDSLLDALTGTWSVSGTVRNWPIKYALTSEWTLKHQFVRLDMRDERKPSTYEASVFIGYDEANTQYVAHWLDAWGGHFSETLGFGVPVASGIRFTFEYPDGPCETVFTLQQDRSWTIHMEDLGRDGKRRQLAHYVLQRPPS
jgi:predicted RNA methylase